VRRQGVNAGVAVSLAGHHGVVVGEGGVLDIVGPAIRGFS